MIKIDNLTKIYKSKRRIKVKALDNIDLTLPNNGLVFVLGKSGSGKSTLLNLIGGLDSITEGNIVVDGNDISNFSESKFCDYRNTHIGFIFQDYHLIDELTVYDNICLALNLRRIEDKDLVSNALKKVDLEGYENRYPTELSGGERQRVAIARAIVKSPRIILADEPTGNLDTNTANAIIQILKELSKERLILIVSHNRNDAYKYGDRIIELAKGNIINDKSRNPNYKDNVVFENNIIYYPCDKVLDDSDVNVINSNMSKENKLVVVNDKYIETKESSIESNKVNIEKKSLSILKELGLSLKFLKNKVFSIFFSSFMVSAIMVILALALTIIKFDAGEILESEMNKMEQTSLFMEKFSSEQEQNNLDKKYYVEVLQNDIDEFKISGYNGNIYEVFNYTLPITTRQNFTGSQFRIFSDSIYLDETLGTMIVGEDFLTSKFGEIEYLAVSEAFNPSGVIITDYVADSILLKNTYYKGKTYHDIIGDYSFSTGLYNYGYVNAIIKTNYKEKHNELFTQINYTSTNNINGLFENELFIKFTNDIYSKLGFSYSLNRNLKKEIYEKINFCWLNRLTIDGNDYLPNSGDYLTLDALNEFNLNDNQIAMNYKKYNEIFGTEYTTSNLNDFIPHKIVIEQYRYADYTKKKVILSVEVEIVKIYDKQLYLGSFYVNENLLKKYKENLVFTKGLYFDSNENLDIVIEVANKLNFEQKLFVVEAIHTMTKAVDVFIPIFELIAIVLCGGIIFILVNFSTKMIKDKMHDIGILKALGTQNRSIGIVFGIQIVLIAIVTMLMSTVGYYFFIDLANDILIASLKELAPGHVMLDLDFLKFKMVVLGFNIVLIIALSLISLVIPMIKIKNIKPVKIIKTKE